MVRTSVSTNAKKPRQNNVTVDVGNLTDAIEDFGAPEITPDFIDATENTQKDFLKEYQDFIDILEEISNDFTSDATDLHLRIELLKVAAAAMNPLPHHKLRELTL